MAQDDMLIAVVAAHAVAIGLRADEAWRIAETVTAEETDVRVMCERAYRLAADVHHV